MTQTLYKRLTNNGEFIMKYQIICEYPTYHPIYDGICGSALLRLPMSYINKNLAKKLADIMYERDFGECSYHVVEFGNLPNYWKPYSVQLNNSFDGDEIPF
jgi:hypothetical protein